MRKSTIAVTALVGVALVLFVAIPFMVGTGKIGGKIDSGSRLEACRLSIIAAQEAKYLGIKSGEKSYGLREGVPKKDIQCERGTLLIRYKDIVENGKISQQKLDAVIARDLKQAWDATGSGQFNPFSDYESSGGIEFQSLCIIWDTVKFDDELRKFLDKNNLKLSFNFNSLSTTTIPNTQKTYAKYLFDKDASLKNVADKIINIDEGTTTISKQYNGDLLNSFSLLYWTGFRKLEGHYAWAVDIVSSDKSFSDYDAFMPNNNRYRICDIIEN